MLDAQLDSARGRDMLAALAVVAAVVAVALGGQLVRRLSPRPSQQQCVELLDRYLQLASQERHPDVDERAIRDAQQAARSQSGYTADLAACQQALSRSQVECGLKTPNVDEMERCLQ